MTERAQHRSRRHAGAGGRGWDINRFDRWGGRYDRSLFQPLFFARVHRMLVANLSPTAGQCVLDVGCGTGALAMRIVRAGGGRVTGIDPATTMVRIARKRSASERLRFIVGMAEALPFAEASFDAAVSSVSAHHWQDAETGFRELGRVVRPGGRIVIADGTDFGPIVRLLRFIGRVPADHHHGWDTTELGRLVYAAGFHRVRVRHRRLLGGRLVALEARR